MPIRKKSERGSEKQYMVDGKEIPMVCSICSPGVGTLYPRVPLLWEVGDLLSWGW